MRMTMTTPEKRLCIPRLEKACMTPISKSSIGRSSTDPLINKKRRRFQRQRKVGMYKKNRKKKKMKK